VPYAKSASRKEFDAIINTFLSQIKYASIKKNNIPHDIQQCVYRNAIFQTSAAIEEYLTSLLEDWIYQLGITNKSNNKIPTSLRFYSQGKMKKDIYQSFIMTGNESKFIEQLSKFDYSNNYISDAKKIHSTSPLANCIKDKKYPSKDNIISLFKRFDIPNIFNLIQKRGKKNYKNILSSFSDVRTAIAHEHPTPNLTSVDTKHQLILISDFIAKIDMVTYSNVIKISGADCWKVTRL